jgi:hypothetical protein
MSYFTCPHCNQQIQASVPSLSYQPTHTQTFASTTPWNTGNLPPTPGEWERRIPFRAPSVSQDILPALAAAAVSGLFGVACSLTASALTEWPLWASLPVGLVNGFFAWVITHAQHNGTLYQTERFTAYEAEAAAPAPKASTTITVRVKERDNWHYRELPGDPKALKEFAQLVTLGESFAERTATKAGLTQAQFGQLADIFTNRGWAEWRHPQRKQQGIELGRNGRAVLRAIASTPLPDDD